MAEWASGKQALEIRGANHVRVLEITLNDPEGYGPNSGWYTTAKTLRLVDNTQWQRTSSGTVDNDYWPGVLDWGTIYQAANCGGAFGTLPDCQYTVANIKIAPLLPGSDVNAGTGPTPEPKGDEIKLSDLMRYYEWTGATVTDKIISYEDASINQASADYQSTTLYTGIIYDVRVDGDTIQIDTTQNVNALQSIVGNKFVEESSDRVFNGQMVPVLFGEYVIERTGAASADDPDFVRAGAKPHLVPAVPWKMGDAGVSGEHAVDFLRVWMDSEGVNTGWEDQQDWQTIVLDSKPLDSTMLWRYIPDADCFAELIEGTSDGQTEFVDDPTATNINTQIYVRTHKYAKAYAWIPCVALQEDSGSAITNPGNMVNRDWTNYATLDLASTSNIATFRIPPVAPLGRILSEASAVQAWVLLDKQTITGSPAIAWGLWYGSQAAGGALTVGGGADATATLASVAVPDLLYLQTDHGGSIAASYFEETDALGQWRWLTNGTSPAEVFVRVKCHTAVASKTVRILACGIRVTFELLRGETSRQRLGYGPIGGPGGFAPNPNVPFPDLSPSLTPGGSHASSNRWITTGGAEPIIDNIWVNPAITTLDDDSGTITGTGDTSLDDAAEISAGLILKWADGVASSDMNLSTATTTAGFGSFRKAQDDLSEWMDEVDGCTTSDLYKIQLRCLTSQPVGFWAAEAMKHTPATIYKTIDGTYYMVVYPEPNTTIPTRVRYANYAGNQVYFHPNTHHSSGTRYGQPYNFDPETFQSYLTPIDGVYNDFRVNFGLFPPTGTYIQQIHANSAGYKVWDETTDTYEVDSGNTLGDRIETRLALSAARYGQRPYPVVNAYTISDERTATAYLYYLAFRYSLRRVIVEFESFTEAYDVKPGHVISIDNDTNLVMPVPSYGVEDWEDLDFIVLDVRHIPNADGLRVWIRAEQLARV